MPPASWSGDNPPSAVIFGCQGQVLTEDERRFFADCNPFGFILFARNIDNPDQVRRLVQELRSAVGQRVPVLIDQEGGRVARLRPPHWPALPASARLGGLWESDPGRGSEAGRLHGAIIGAYCAGLGIDVVCAPMLDVRGPWSNQAVIGDRAFSDDPAVVTRMGQAFLDGLAETGVTGVVKHLPGHGRARVDSHDALPRIDAPLADLEKTDWIPFRENAHRLVWGMTAHIVVTAIDPIHPATLSPVVIAEIIRKRIGFDGLLLSDDLGMGALDGPQNLRATTCLDAGCDIALHCSGNLDDMVAIARTIPAIDHEARRRLEAFPRPEPMVSIEVDDAVQHLNSLLDG